MRTHRPALGAISAVSAVLAACFVLVGVTTSSSSAAALEAGKLLPAGPAGLRVSQISASGSYVYATWGTSRTTLYRTPADGSGDWEEVTDPVEGTPIQDPYGVRDGVVVTHPSSCSYRVIAGGAEWDTTAALPCVSSVTIGAGGDLIVLKHWMSNEQRYHWDVYAAAGPAGGPLASATVPTSATGTWVWTSAARGVLTGHDVSGAQADRWVDAGDDCADAPFADVVGDPSTGPAWAMLACSPGATRRVVVDLTDGLGPLTTAPSDLGSGFTLIGSSDADGAFVAVSDFGHSATTHDYGPYAASFLWSDGRSGSRSTSVDGGTPYLAFLTPPAQGAGTDGISVAPLPWLGPLPTPLTDTVAPTIGPTTGSPAYVRLVRAGTPLTFGWGPATDDDQGQPTVDVQVKESVSFEHGWQPVAGAQGVFGSSADYTAENQSKVCFRARATDRVGNTSSWTLPRCTWVDAFRPTMDDGRRDTSGLNRVVESVRRSQVTGRFHGDDDVAVASYDVERRESSLGHAFDAWADPRAWQGLTVHHVEANVAPGHEICTRAKARDHVGRVSGWGDLHCVAVPLDDTRLKRHGGAHRVGGPGYLGGSATALGRRGSVTLRGVSGRELWVRARGGEDICPLVSWGGKPFFGGTHPCNPTPDHGRNEWYAWRVPRLRHGTVRITTPFYGSLAVDAVAILR